MNAQSVRACLLVLASCVGASTAALANRYKIVDLGVAREPLGINVAEQVVANSGPQDHPRAQAWYSRIWRYLPDYSVASAINDDQDVVGWDAKHLRPMIWPRHGAGIPVGLPNNARVGKGHGINFRRAVVGSYAGDDGNDRCFLWTPESGSSDLGLMKSGLSCVAYGVNDSGQVTGSAATLQDGQRHAFRWAHGKFTDLGVLPEADSSTGLAMDNDGNVVGVSESATGAQAFLWNGSLVSLDPGRQYRYSTAASINFKGVIVGSAGQKPHADSVAVRFEDALVIPLVSELDPSARWILETATSVNSQGEIVGVGHKKGDSDLHAYMLKPE